MEDIAQSYGAIHHEFNIIYELASQELEARQELESTLGYKGTIDDAWVYLEQAKNEIEECLDKAQKYDELRYKQSQGGKKSANNMTKAERVKRATKASHSRY